MTTAVKVTAKEGFVVIPSENNPEFGYIRVEQKLPEFVNGWANIRTRSALIRGSVEMLKQLDFKEGQELSGRIVIKETIDTPLDSKGEVLSNAENLIKRAGKTNVPCSIKGDVIYRITEYDATGTQVDVLLTHDNTAEIRVAQSIEKKAAFIA